MPSLLRTWIGFWHRETDGKGESHISSDDLTSLFAEAAQYSRRSLLGYSSFGSGWRLPEGPGCATGVPAGAVRTARVTDVCHWLH